MFNCGINNLSRIIFFKNLKELNASNNKISDLIDIEMRDELKFIDLSNNYKKKNLQKLIYKIKLFIIIILISNNNFY